MPTDFPAMKDGFRRFLAAFAIAAVALLLPVIMASLYLGPPANDLVRIGHLPQRDFTPDVPQPLLVRVPGPAEGEAVDVAVLGDSFSRYNAWQSELHRLTGKRVATWSFDGVGCTGDWIDKAISGRLPGGAKVVVVQTVEREFRQRFHDEPGCARPTYPRKRASTGVFGGPPRWWQIFPIDIRYLGKSVRQFRAARNAVGRYPAGKAVMVDLVRTDLFSNRRADRLLYYMYDEQKFGDWSDAEAAALIERMVQWRARAAAAGITLVFVTVPDKSSVYWPYIKPDQQLPYPERGERLFSMIGERLGESYNLLPYLREQALLQPDLYRPDDSHFGTNGYRLLAARIASWLPAAAPDLNNTGH